MPTLSAAQLAVLLPELQRHLFNSTIMGVYGHCDLIFVCAQPMRAWYFHLIFSHGQTTCFLSEHQAALPPTNPWATCLQNSKITSLDQLQQDRLLKISCATAAGPTLYLIAELTGRHGNLFVLDGAERVIRTMRADHSQRGLRSDRLYEAPPFKASSKAQQDPLGLLGFPPDGSRSRQLILQWQHDRQQQQWQTIVQPLSKAQQRIQRRIQHLENQWEQAQQYETYRRWSELLPSAFGQLKKLAESVQVPDYYQPEAPLIKIPLQPTLDLGANIQRYAHHARRYAAAIPRIEIQLLQAWEHQQLLEQALADIQAGKEQSTPDLGKAQQCLERLKQQGLLSPETTDHQTKEMAIRLPYRVYTSRVGHTIWVGRSARDNEKLTFQLARGNDYWLHVRDTSGSHVVVRLNRNQSLQPETLQDAALLAAHYSKLATEPSVAVMVTQVKHVKRLKGAAPGTVHVASSKCVWVEHVQQKWQDFVAQQEGESSLKF